MKVFRIFQALFLTTCLSGLHAQTSDFTRQDTLRGSITPERAWWNLTHYDLSVKVDPDKQYISGSNTIAFTAVAEGDRMQIDLQPPMKIDGVNYKGKELSVTSEGNAHFIIFPDKIGKNTSAEIAVRFSGYPRVAKNAPWDGGFSWKTDANGKPFIATSCQGLGASVWWPNKDHMYDEPDNGMDIHLTVPEGLTGVANGRLVSSETKGDQSTFHWKVTQPINNYGVNANIGDYVHFETTYTGEKGPLDMDFYVLSYELDRAKEQFKQAELTMEALEHWFGPYPFYEDSYKLVQVPYLGMEHQSSVTYGNGYQNGYLGRDLSGTGWGLKFDFIIIHESGHEWFANNITNRDIADMWIHEGFTAYSETLYLDYHFGRDAGDAYVQGTRNLIQNDRPVIGVYDVNQEGSSDMYYKGANMIHSLRAWMQDDETFRKLLRDMNQHFYHSVVSSAEVEAFISEGTKLPLEGFFNQYLRSTQIPVLQWHYENDTFTYRYTDIVEGFRMPVDVVNSEGARIRIFPTSEWQKTDLTPASANWMLEPNFYVDQEQTNPSATH